MAKVTLRGKEQHTIGELPSTGGKAPDFCLTTTALKDVSLADYSGKTKLLYIVPSLDTPVCATSTKKIDELTGTHSDVVVLIVSADLPFAMGRFCGMEKLKNVIPLSMMRSKHFAKDYGVLLTDGPLAGVTARAVVIVDDKDEVVYSQWVDEISDEPDYNGIIAVLDR